MPSSYYPLAQKPLSIKQIQERVSRSHRPIPTSVRPFLSPPEYPKSFVRQDWGVYSVRRVGTAWNSTKSTEKEARQPLCIGRAQLIHADCFDWLEQQEDNSFQAVPD